jgi:chitinase
MCTHIIYSFAKLTNGELAPYEWNDESTDWSKGMYERTMDLKKINPSLKVLIAVGGVNFTKNFNLRFPVK